MTGLCTELGIAEDEDRGASAGQSARDRDMLSLALGMASCTARPRIAHIPDMADSVAWRLALWRGGRGCGASHRSATGLRGTQGGHDGVETRERCKSGVTEL